MAALYEVQGHPSNGLGLCSLNVRRDAEAAGLLYGSCISASHPKIKGLLLKTGLLFSPRSPRVAASKPEGG